jgi:hypothetical protein
MSVAPDAPGTVNALAPAPEPAAARKGQG